MPVWLVSLLARPLIASFLGKIKAGFKWVFSSWLHLVIMIAVGASLYALHEHRARLKAESDLEACRLGRAGDIQTWNERVAAAKAETKRQQGLYEGASRNAQTYYNELAQADQSLRDYKSANWLRVPAQGALPTTTPRLGGDSAVHGEAPAGAFLAISEADLDACDADYKYAAAAFHLGQTLIQQGQAVLQTGTSP